MMDWYLRELNYREYQRNMLREAERERLVRQALAGRDTKRPLFCRMLSWLGHCLVAWGQWLQQRFAADRPIPSFPVVHRPQ
jgi:hypothetical protein